MKVAVIGAGIAGLASAFSLKRRGVDVEVFEAADRPGGVLGTIERDGFLLETAAVGFLLREPTMLELIDVLGLRERLRSADPTAKHRFVYTRGALHAVPSSPPALLKSDVVPLSTKLRMAAELFSPRGHAEDESLGSFARRHVGAHATSILVDAVQTGIYAGDVERLSVHATFPQMVELERRHRSLLLGMMREGRSMKAAAAARAAKGLSGVLTTFDRGMQVLVDALASALGPRLRLRTRVRRLSRTAEGWRVLVADAWGPTAPPSGTAGERANDSALRFVADDGSARATELKVDHVIVATPAPVASELLASVDPLLAQELSSIPYAPIAAVHVGFRSLPNPPTGFGFLVPSAEQRGILGALYVSSFFPHRAPPGATLFTVMVGGAKHPERVALDDAALEALVLKELEAILGVRQPPDFVQAIRWHPGLPQYEVGHLARMARIDAALKQHPGLHLAGNPYRGVSVLDCVKAAAALSL
ncbi:MAG: protoporphyrinogen oxidase [Myxococcaceae bacterium]|nr:protoporphyrinogen oxidase [Myxococcaceae bacterium]